MKNLWKMGLEKSIYRKYNRAQKVEYIALRGTRANRQWV